MCDVSNGLARFITNATTVDRFPLVISSKYNIPYLLNKPGVGHVIILLRFENTIKSTFLQQKIEGEVYSVDSKMLSFLDDFEGHPTYYTRMKIEVTSASEDFTDKPWVYFINQYKQELLDLPMYANYDSYASHGLRYVERCDRVEWNVLIFINIFVQSEASTVDDVL